MRIETYGLGGYDPTKPDNNLIEVREVEDPPPVALDPVGALATLLAVTGTLDVQDAANAVRLSPDDLVAEAQAWAIAQEANGGN